MYLKSIFCWIIVICCINIYIISRYSVVQQQNNECIIDRSNATELWISQFLENSIHLVIVTANNEFNDMSLNLIKSILFHRRKSYNLTFHIFTDCQGRISLSNYFKYLNNDCTEFRLYPLENLIKSSQRFLDRHHITNTHYSGLYAFSKIFIHEFLPSDISRIILLDADIIVLDDIYSIWQQFLLFTPKTTVMGLVPWYPSLPIDYKYSGSLPDPYITGVVLYDIKICRSINFTKLLSDATNNAFKQFQLKSFVTADQTMLNLFAMYYPKYIVALPCYINGHTYHYLIDGPTWKSACKNQYPRTAHVVPSKRLKDPLDYFGHLYIFYKKMPIEWLSYCGSTRFK
ncbi:unnamed protein product [Adineta steineri]|uniref:Uncharacterized protein n=2 Tax=Adineta steineri TaxID=433720 RepID=A0A819F7T9_9BILA|nr:unnamed protein product [Adineta steineri]CAF1035543.1 unnamed protein product [Adineta steineri]CAF3650153.1 unnamed protein product [Adineta steineri]CAF3753787.1 unnamed protein product [Adineta steineri]CAF3861899.1 unnamed protein product [Adineta steineri]